MDDQTRWKQLLKSLQPVSGSQDLDPEAVSKAMQGYEPTEIALALEELEPETCQHVFGMLGETPAAQVLGLLDPDRAKTILRSLGEDKAERLVRQLPEREAAALLSDRSQATLRALAKTQEVPSRVIRDASQRAEYPEDSVGRIMTTQFVRLRPEMTAVEALDAVRQTNPACDIPEDMCVVESGQDEAHQRLVGVLSIRDAVMAAPDQKVQDLMAREVKSIDAYAKSMDVARFLSKQKFMALPVTDRDGFLVGVIPADDLMMVALARLYNRYSKSVGTDAAAMERLTPFQAAGKRVPWLLGTMVIELGAALIVAYFNPILQKVILLASFMPVISAVSGNVGLQAAAITVRGLDVGPGSLGDRGRVLLKEIATTLFMAIVCGLVLGVIGGFWSRHLALLWQFLSAGEV